MYPKSQKADGYAFWGERCCAGKEWRNGDRRTDPQIFETRQSRHPACLLFIITPLLTSWSVRAMDHKNTSLYIGMNDQDVQGRCHKVRSSQDVRERPSNPVFLSHSTSTISSYLQSNADGKPLCRQKRKRTRYVDLWRACTRSA